MRVLYIHMIGPYGGSSRSLIEMISAFPVGEVEAFFVTPRGLATEQFRKVATDIIEVRGMTQFDNTNYSHYRGLRWLILLREIFYLPFTVIGLIHARMRWRKIDLIHVNEYTGILPWLLARKLFGAPVIVHVRSLACMNRSSKVTQWVNNLLQNKANAVIAIDENVKKSLPVTIPVNIIHNSFSLTVGKRDENLVKIIKHIPIESFTVGFVGNLLRVKGLFDLVEAANILQKEKLDIHYLIIGDNTRDNSSIIRWILNKFNLSQDIKNELFDKIRRYKLTHLFHFSGFTNDIHSAYSAMNVLCFPSHYDAPGRPIFEAALLGIPSIAAIRCPNADTLIDGESGLAIKPQDPVQLALAIKSLAIDRNRCKELGKNARELAKKNFDSTANAKKTLELYKRCIK